MTSPPPADSPKDLVKGHSSAPEATNPFASSASISVSVPESIEIRLVDASVLADYEIWVFLTSVLWGAVIGFLVALVQAPAGDKSRFTAITVVFAVCMILCVGMAIHKRRKLAGKSRRVRFKVGDAIHD